MLYWAQFIRDQKASGLSIRAFCENARVRENIYYYWQKKIRDVACEHLLMSQMDDGSASFIPKGFAEVVVHGDIDCEIAVHDEVSAVVSSVSEPAAVAGSVSQSGAVATTSHHAIVDNAQSAIAIASEAPAQPAPPSMLAAPAAPVTCSPDTTESTGQIQIESQGIKISADALYPMDKLTEVLKGLVRTWR